MQNKVNGPFFSEEPKVNDDALLAMMESNVLRLVPAGTVSKLLDDAPPQDRNFTDSFIGRGETTPWPPRSPDLTPLDCLS
jgi:hypothetical protein